MPPLTHPASISTIVTALLAGLLIPATSFAQTTVEAQVLDTDGDPIADAEVIFLELDLELITDDEGHLQLEIPHEGRFSVLIEAEDYEPKWTELTVSDDDEPRQHAFTLGVEEEEPRRDRAIARTTSASPLDNPVDYQPVTTLSREDLQRRASNSYGQMLDGSPGVAARSFGPAPSRPVIRGLGGERVLVLQNGERTGDVSSTAHDHHISIDPLEAERVDVIRGPASLLYGSSALGGVVNIMDERIPREWAPGIFGEAAAYGSSGQPTGALAASAGYGFENNALRARFSHRMASDLRTATEIIPDTGIQSTTADIGASHKTDRGLYGFSFGLQHFAFGLPEALDDPDESVELISDRYFLQTRAERELSGFLEHLEWRLLANHYQHDEIETEIGPDGRIDQDLELSYDVWAASSSLSLRHGDIGPIDRGALGIQIRARDLQLGGDEVLSPDAREASAGVYAFEEIPLADSLRLQFGLRPEIHLMEARENDDFQAPPDSSRRSPTLSGSIGLHAQPIEEASMGLQFARAHRVPIVEELHSDAPHLGTGQYEIGDPTLENEVGYGADIYTSFQTQYVDIELSGFLNHINDFVFLEPTGETDTESGYPVYVYRGADAQLFGAEWTTRIRPWRSLEFRSTVDHVRAYRLEGDLEHLPTIPPLRARLGVGWNADDYWSLLRVRTARSQQRTAPAENATEGYALLDVEGGFRLRASTSGTHNFTLRLANAFDTAYSDHLSRVRGLQSPMPGRALHATYRWTY